MKHSQVSKSDLMIPTLLFASTAFSLAAECKQKNSGDRPNILFVISDDQSYPNASIYGNKIFETPAFDRIAKSGVLFNNAYVTSPGSSPSRASILTGRYPWQNEEAGTHDSRFQTKYISYPFVLEKNGYHIGYTGKGWEPGNFNGWEHNPAGPSYNTEKLTPPYTGISDCDYVANFEVFLNNRKDGQPFCFWFGCWEPHRRFEKDSYQKAKINLTNIDVPDFLPDNDVIRGDIADYALEIRWFDKQLNKILNILDSIGALENTLIIVTSDNGMAFPRAKANCYDAGIHVPLAMSWKNVIPHGRIIDEHVSLVDIASTILDAANVEPDNMQPISGKSMLPQIKSTQDINKNKVVLAGRERHSSSRYNNTGYPQRVIVTNEFLYIYNMHSERFPAGDPFFCVPNESDLYKTGYFDIDASPTKTFLIENAGNSSITPYFLSAMAKRPQDELYNLRNDPHCMKNLANDEKYSAKLKALKKFLIEKLKETGDTRFVGNNSEIWETYPRFSIIREFPFPVY